MHKTLPRDYVIICDPGDLFCGSRFCKNKEEGAGRGEESRQGLSVKNGGWEPQIGGKDDIQEPPSPDEKLTSGEW
jgi:hypothetical protein